MPKRQFGRERSLQAAEWPRFCSSWRCPASESPELGKWAGQQHVSGEDCLKGMSMLRGVPQPSTPHAPQRLPHLQSASGSPAARPPGGSARPGCASQQRRPEPPQTLTCASRSSSNVASVIFLFTPLPKHRQKQCLRVSGDKLYLAPSSCCWYRGPRVSPWRARRVQEPGVSEPAGCHTAVVRTVLVDLRGPRECVACTVHCHRQNAVASSRQPGSPHAGFPAPLRPSPASGQRPAGASWQAW